MHFYFFTDIDLLNVQSVGNEFGKVSTDPNNKFHVTSIHSSSSQSNAYAICNGEVAVIDVPNSSPQQVNLILKPSHHPKINLPKIKYVIYRGILKSSLIIGNDIAAANSNDLTDSIWATNAKEIQSIPPNSSPPPNPTPPATALAVYVDNTLTNPDDTPLFKTFFRNDNSKSQHPKVDAGWNIGEFNSTSFGIELIADTMGYEPTVSTAKLDNNIISVTPLPNTPTQKERFMNRNEKEVILNYIDPCAFYGSFIDSKIKVKSSNNSTASKSGNAIYADVLNGSSGYFRNRNIIYFDIRNELNYSFDYYENYLNPLKVAFDESTSLNQFTSRSYYVDNWPLLKLTTSDFPANNNSTDNFFRVSFPQGDNEHPFLFVAQGKIKRRFIEKLKGKKRFKILTVDATTSYTDDATFILPNYTGNNTTELISSYVRLRYIKSNFQVESLTQIKTAVPGYDSLDNIFHPFETANPWDENTTNTIVSNYYGEETYTDAIRHSGQSYISGLGFARDVNADITFFTAAIDKFISAKKHRSIPFSITGSAEKTSNDTFLQKTASKHNLFYNKVQLDFGNPSNDPFVEFFSSDPSHKGIRLKRVLPQDFNFRKISGSDFSSLQDIINGTHQTISNPNFLSGFRIHLGFRFNESGKDNNDIAYTKHDVVLRGFVEDPNDISKVLVKEVNSGVAVYTFGTGNTLKTLLDTPPKKSKRGFTVSQDTTTGTWVEPDGTNADTNTPRYKIECTIYLYRGGSLSNPSNDALYNAYKTYFSDTVKQVWDSRYNKGLVASYNAAPSNNQSAEIERDYIVDSSKIIIKDASDAQFKQLSNNEVLFIVEQGIFPYDRPAVIDDERRIGIMYVKGTLNGGVYTPDAPEDVAPAHEFGHIMGLADRYVYTCFMHSGNFSANPIPDGYRVGAFATPYVKPDSGGLARMYVSEDAQYVMRYNWVFNIMSNGNKVPNGTLGPNSQPIEREDDFKRFYQYFRPNLENDPNPPPNGPSQIARFAVMVTKYQFDIIKDTNPTKEIDRIRWLFFKQDGSSPNNNPHFQFDGSFVGVQNRGDTSEKIVTDDEFTGEITTSPDLSQLADDYEHRMDRRLLETPADPQSTQNQPRDLFYGYFSPSVDAGNNFFKSGEPKPFNKSQITTESIDTTDSVTMYDVELGGYAHGYTKPIAPRLPIEEAVNFKRNKLAEIKKVLDDPNDSLKNQNHQDLLDQIESTSPKLGVTTDLTIQSGNTLTRPDIYKDYGDGDTNGHKIWNRRVDNTVATGDDNGDPGDQPYYDRTFEMKLFPGPTSSDVYRYGDKKYKISDANTQNLTNPTRTVYIYTLKFTHFTNRKAIITIMAENGS